MALKFFNTLSRSVEEFVPLDPVGKKVGMYCCGPTVHDFAHIGNFRTFVFADLMRRYLEFKGYTVQHVMNITDVEDKIIKRVRESGQTREQYTGKYEAEFFRDFDALGCKRPQLTPRATEHIDGIVSLIEKLMARGLAYKAADGSVYFSIEKYRGCGCTYGQLANLNFDAMRVGERVKSDEYEKESLSDFALWKARVPEDGDVFWPSPWGEGRPGWHIECSAMSTKLLGQSFDIHMGGEDLIFPHHEDEIAQSEGALVYPPGERFVKYWLHGAHLLVEGKKMSKSLGNFFTLRELTEKRGFRPREIRYVMLTAHYRETFNFTLDGINGARTALARLDECIGKLREIAFGVSASSGYAAEPSEGETPNLLADFETALDDDLNISAAWGAVFNWVRETNRMLAANAISKEIAASALADWAKIDAVLGVSGSVVSAGVSELTTATDIIKAAVIPSEITELLEARQAARKAKDFKQADAIRDELKAKGWVIEDTPKGPKLKQL